MNTGQTGLISDLQRLVVPVALVVAPATNQGNQDNQGNQGNQGNQDN